MTIDIYPSSPMTGLSMPYAENPRDRVMTENEIRIFWNGIDAVSQVSSAVKCAFKLALLTGQRRAEVSGIAKQELNLTDRLWSLSKDRVKNNTAHDVPLSDLALELIDQATALSGNSPYLFPSPRNNQKPINPKALTRAWSRASKQLGFEDIVLHDFRRTCATGLQKLGVRLEVTEAILNHKSGSVSGLSLIHI